MIAVRFRERLGGALVLEPDAREHPVTLELDVEWRSRSATIVVGEIDAATLLGRSAVTGAATVARRGLVTCSTYQLEIASRPGWRLELERALSLAHPYTSITVMRGRVEDEGGALVARCLVRFDLRGDVGALVRSLRIVRS